MGGTNSSEPNESMLLENYQLISNEDDKRFGDISIYKNRQSGELVWIKDVVVEDEMAQEHYRDYLKSKTYNEDVFIPANPHFILGGSGGKICGNCSGGSKLKVIMEFYERDLEGEILRRGHENVIKIITTNRISSLRLRFGIS